MKGVVGGDGALIEGVKIEGGTNEGEGGLQWGLIINEGAYK